MWELGCEESWVLKNWCFWTMVLEKTLESPLNCKDIKPVHPKGNQSQYSMEQLMLKLKLQYFGHLMWRADSLEKILMLGKTERRGEADDRGWDGWMASLTQWTWVWVSFRSWCWTGKPDMESQSRTRLSDWTELTVFQSVFTNLWLSAFWNLGFFSQSTVIAYNSLVYLSLTTNDIEHSVTYHVYMDILCFEVDILIFKYDIFPISIPLSVTFWLIPKYSLYILCKCILRVLQLFFLYHGSLHFA